tara:strand:+ start:619 stop:3183 length:2565 start_codon:yes stop_codon:yes gene_type:complete
MSFIHCVNNAVAEGIIPKEKEAKLKIMVEKLTEKYVGRGNGLEEAEAKAAKDAYFAFTVEANNKKRQAVLQAVAEDRAVEFLFRYRNKKGEIDPGQALEHIIGFMDTPQGNVKYLNVETRMRVINGQSSATMYEVLESFRLNVFGETKNKATLNLMLKEMFEPGSTKNPHVEQLVKAWLDTYEQARKKFNAEGGRIVKLDSNYMPQHHDQLKVALKEKDPWIEFIMPLLDRDKMINQVNGLPFSNDDLIKVLGEVWKTISDDGYLKQTSFAQGGSKLGNTRLDHRFLHFKDGDSWNTYNTEFGAGDPFNTMLAHLDSINKDIALMQVMGPNPDAFMKKMRFEVTKWANTQPGPVKSKAKNRANAKMNRADAMYLYLKGDLNIPVNEGLAKFGASFRNIATASYLGSAAFLALGDFNLTRVNAQFSGLPQWKSMVTNMRTYLSPLTSSLKGQKQNTYAKVAITSGLVAEHWSTIASGAARVSVDRVAGSEFSRRLADFILRTTQLSWLTQAGRWGAGMEFLAFSARNTEMSFKQIKKSNPKFAEYLESYGISNKEWEIIRKTKLFNAGEYDVEWKGAEYLRPDDIAARTDIDPKLANELSLKYNHAMQEFVNYAVPVASAKGATVLGKSRPGTKDGEIIRMMLQFKQFPITLFHQQLARGMGRKTHLGKVGYILPFLVSTTLMGAVSFELKNLIKGKNISFDDNLNPLDPENFGYWLDAMLHGGGLGFAGDLIFGGRYSFDPIAGRLAEGAGPVPTMAATLADITFGNLYDAINGDKTTVSADISRFISKNSPGSSAWYMRLLLERYLFEYMQELTDPNYKSKIRRKMKRTKKDEKNTYWWKPGQKSPSQTPGLN